MRRGSGGLGGEGPQAAWCAVSGVPTHRSRKTQKLKTHCLKLKINSNIDNSAWFGQYALLNRVDTPLGRILGMS